MLVKAGVMKRACEAAANSQAGYGRLIMVRPGLPRFGTGTAASRKAGPDRALSNNHKLRRACMPRFLICAGLIG